ncbi:MAG: hypothetical protein CMH55_03655 [Myxococcales bacterium]|nr:hypothetical protein [Myxococcales bacterium]
MRSLLFFCLILAACIPDDSGIGPDGRPTGLCVASRLACHDNMVKQCTPDGQQRVIVTRCGEDQYCSQAACHDRICEPYLRRCDEGIVLLCDQRGSRESALIDGDCAGLGLQCDDGRCVRQPCDPACGEGMYCDGEGTCLNQQCQPMVRGCVENSVRTCNQWGSGYLEELDEDCGDRAQCLADACVPVAGGDAGPRPDAGGGSGGGCASHEECPVHQICNAHSRQCENLTPPACRDNTQCPPGQFCERTPQQEVGQCQFGQPQCREDGDCDAGLVCQRGHCIEAGSGGCTTDVECGSGRICVDAACVVGCRGDGDCAEGHLCRDGACVPSQAECTRHSDCAADQACLNSACIRPVTRQGQACGADGDCGWGERCFSFNEQAAVCMGTCGTGSDCPERSICMAALGARLCVPDTVASPNGGQATLNNGEACEPAGATLCKSALCTGTPSTCRANCGSDRHCQGQQVCTHLNQGNGETAYLLDICADPGEFGQRPGANGPGENCATGDACASGICLDGSCRQPCCTSGECPNRHICRQERVPVPGASDWQVNLCIPVPPAFTLGTSVGGATCAVAGDCRSGICTSGRCVDACCGRRDCAGLAACTASDMGQGGDALMNLCITPEVPG